jgi:hypothetical protein
MRELRWLTLLLLPFLMAAKCDKEGNLIVEPDEFSTVVDLVNGPSNQQPIHIFVASQNETFPCCEVATGGARNVQLTLRPVNNYVFRAGRGGAILNEKTCRTTILAVASDSYRVTWIELQSNPEEGFLFCAGSGWQ